MKIFKATLLLPAFFFSITACKPKQTVAEQPRKTETPTAAAATPVAQNTPVKKDTAFSVVSVDRTKKTVYRGLKNPFTIVVPNAVSTKVEGNGVMKVDDLGHYKITPGAGTKAEIKITAVMPDGSTFTESQFFNIKNVPTPDIGIAGTPLLPAMAEAMATEEELKKAEIYLLMPDFDYDFDLAVAGFEVLFPNGKNVKVNGNRFDAKVFEMLKKVKHGNKIKIYNVKIGPMPYGEIPALRIDPVFLKINKKTRPKKK